MGVITFFTWIAFVLFFVQTAVSDDDFSDFFEDYIDKKFENEEAKIKIFEPSFRFADAKSYSSKYGSMYKNLGREITADVQRELSPLKNLGATIQENVNKQLEPVRALDMQAKMTKGVGGTTVIVYTSPKPVKLLVRDGETYICTDGKINNEPRCNSKKRFWINEKEDYCYSRTFARGNDDICIANSPKASLSVIAGNNRFSCSSDDEHKTLVLKISEYEQLCGRDPWDVTFTYYPDRGNPSSVQIPSNNPYVICTITRRGGCTFKGDAIFGKANAAGGNVDVNVVRTFT